MKNFVLLLMLLIVEIAVSQESRLLADSESQKGIYFTFEDFIKNNPSTEDSFYIDSNLRTNTNWENTYSFQPRYHRDDKKIKNIWAFTDGENAYISFDKEFFIIEKDFDSYFFYGYGIADYAGYGVAGVLGGAIGGALYGLAANNTVKDEKHKYIISPNTGNIYTSKGEYKESEFAKLVVYRMDRKEIESPVVFKVADSISLSFLPNSYAELYFPMTNDPIRISYGSDYSEHIDSYFDSERKRYVEISYSEKTNILKFENMNTSTGVFNSYRPKKVQKKRIEKK